jgi:hypothetical protein
MPKKINALDHLMALRAADDRFYAERDRRYTEVAQEREKALKIKERSNEIALGLARDIQTYKDERDNRLREQITSERGEYVTHVEMRALEDKLVALISPLANSNVERRGGTVALDRLQRTIYGAAAFVSTVLGIVYLLLRK